MVNLEYANAYSEVLEILKHISQEDYDKIPKEKIMLFQNNYNKEYNFTYDMNKTLDEQNVSKKAKTIIAILFRDYWSTDIQREKIKAKEEYDRKIKEQEKYNPDNIFKPKETVSNYESSNFPIEIKKENLIQKILNFIKNIFRRK